MAPGAVVVGVGSKRYKSGVRISEYLKVVKMNMNPKEMENDDISPIDLVALLAVHMGHADHARHVMQLY